MEPPEDPVRQIAESEQVAAPTPDMLPAGKETVMLAAIGAGIGASVAGPAGAVVGGALGWAADVVRRKLRGLG
jgi:hypothetical protein